MTKDTKERIIKAATEVLENKNYQNMKTAEIAKKAGVAEGTLYRYFKNKENIFSEALKEYTSVEMDKVFKETSEKKTLTENLEILGENFYNEVLEDKKMHKILYKAFSEIEVLEVKEILREILDCKLDKLEEIFRWEVEKKDIEISHHELELLSLSVWGIAEVIIKKHILDSKKKDSRKDIKKLLLVYAEILEKYRK